MTGRQRLMYLALFAGSVLLVVTGVAGSIVGRWPADAPPTAIASDEQMAETVLDARDIGDDWTVVALLRPDNRRPGYGIHGPCGENWMLPNSAVRRFANQGYANDDSDFLEYRWMNELIEVTEPATAHAAMADVVELARACQRYTWYIEEQPVEFVVHPTNGPPLGDQALWWQETFTVNDSARQGYTCVIAITGGVVVNVCLGADYSPPSVVETLPIADAALHRVRATLPASPPDEAS